MDNEIDIGKIFLILFQNFNVSWIEFSDIN